MGYDLDLIDDEDGKEETWECVRNIWSRYFVVEPVSVRVLHYDIKQKVNACVFPLKRIFLARKYVETVKGALTFGDFCPDRGHYVVRDGNTPALCSTNKLNGVLSVSELVYDHNRSDAEAKAFDSKHMAWFYKAACLDIETVFNASYRDASL